MAAISGGARSLRRHDQVALSILAQHERVVADNGEPALAVEGDGLEIALPYAKPDAIASRPRSGGMSSAHQLAGNALAVPRA